MLNFVYISIAHLIYTGTHLYIRIKLYWLKFTHFPELQVRTLMSSYTTVFNVTVVEPKPRELQLVSTNDQWTLPSCIPPRAHLMGTTAMHVMPNIARALWETKDAGFSELRSDKDSMKVPLVAVFANTTFELEVSTAAGLDLVFDISIWDGHAWHEYRHAPFQQSENRVKCASEPQECRSIVQVCTM